MFVIRDEDQDPFRTDYHRLSSSRPASRTTSRSGLYSREPDPSVTVVPLDLSRDDDEDDEREEGEITEQLRNRPDVTPRASRDPPQHYATASPSPKSRYDNPMSMDEDRFAGFPDEEPFKALSPTHREECPHGNYPAYYPAYIPEGQDEFGATATFQLNTGELLALVMALETATRNVDDEQVKIARHDPERTVLLQPFLAGDYFCRKHGNF
ncbi:hypothetical protein B0H13DRAFT_2305594 [Mycena leptocephala]|nr:hypothetical protein B0H13DRAFT_2305594 [Mycena leptocephala]